MPLLLVILLKIHANRVGSVPPEGDAPRSIHMDAVCTLSFAAQRVKVETGNLHVLGIRSGIKRVETSQNPIDHSFVHSRPIVLLPKGSERPALERADHRECV